MNYSRFSFHFQGKIPTYAKDTKIFMFASHSHADHYDMDILRLADQYENIHYIFSKDIPTLLLLLFNLDELKSSSLFII